MIIILGLGNPGKKYEKTRHNIGFLAIDEFAKKNYFPGFKLLKNFSALISESALNGRKIILAKPQTFMNESGETAKALIDNYKLSVADILVIHDDLDLALGKIKISKDRGTAGHKGVASIIKLLRTRDFIRFRMGIKNDELRIKNAENFVLEKFSRNEKEILKKVIQKTVSAIETYLKEGLEKAMTEYNQ